MPKANPEALRALREKDGYNGTDFARDCGISPQYLSDIEAGRKPGSPAVLKRMAEVLSVRPSAITYPDTVAS